MLYFLLHPTLSSLLKLTRGKVRPGIFSDRNLTWPGCACHVPNPQQFPQLPTMPCPQLLAIPSSPNHPNRHHAGNSDSSDGPLGTRPLIFGLTNHTKGVLLGDISTSYQQPQGWWQCTMCILGSMFSFQPNKLRHILKFVSWYIIQHIFVPACSVGRKTWFSRKPWFSNSKFGISKQRIVHFSRS